MVLARSQGAKQAGEDARGQAGLRTWVFIRVSTVGESSFAPNYVGASADKRGRLKRLGFIPACQRKGQCDGRQVTLVFIRNVFISKGPHEPRSSVSRTNPASLRENFALTCVWEYTNLINCYLKGL